MYKNLIFLIIFFSILQKAYATDLYKPEWVMYFQNYVVNRQANISVIFNALNLTDEQRKKFIEVTKKDDDLYNKQFEELLSETYELQNLKDSKASYIDIFNQRQKAKYYGRRIKSIAKQEDKDLRGILSRKQRSKYSMIKKLERQDLKRALHPTDYYKKNPQLLPFGIQPQNR